MRNATEIDEFTSANVGPGSRTRNLHVVFDDDHAGALADFAIDRHETILAGTHPAENTATFAFDAEGKFMLPRRLDRCRNRHAFFGKYLQTVDQELDRRVIGRQTLVYRSDGHR
jgi:hypothetical protein